MGPGLRQGLIEVQEMAALLVFPHPLVHDTLLCCPLLSVPPGSRAVGDLSWRESGLPVKGHQPGAGSGQKAWAPLGFSIQYVWDLPSTAQRSAPLELLSRFHGNHSPPERSWACVHLLPCISAPQPREGPSERRCHNRYRKGAHFPLLLRCPQPHPRPSARDGGASPCLPEMGGHMTATCQGFLG